MLGAPGATLWQDDGSHGGMENAVRRALCWAAAGCCGLPVQARCWERFAVDGRAGQCGLNRVNGRLGAACCAVLRTASRAAPLRLWRFSGGTRVWGRSLRAFGASVAALWRPRLLRRLCWGWRKRTKRLARKGPAAEVVEVQTRSAADGALVFSCRCPAEAERPRAWRMPAAAGQDLGRLVVRTWPPASGRRPSRPDRPPSAHTWKAREPGCPGRPSLRR